MWSIVLRVAVTKPKILEGIDRTSATRYRTRVVKGTTYSRISAKIPTRVNLGVRNSCHRSFQKFVRAGAETKAVVDTCHQ
jgi:hypothetical protein